MFFLIIVESSFTFVSIIYTISLAENIIGFEQSQDTNWEMFFFNYAKTNVSLSTQP